MAELVRSHGDTLTVGRSFGNDVVIADPCVDPEQIAFFRTPGGWKVRVVQETNPAMVNGSVIGNEGADISSGDRITVGRTQLRVYGSDHEVGPTHRLLLSSWFGHGRSRPLFALLMVTLACAVAVIAQYQESYTEFEWKEMISASLGLALVILFWASAWALAGRLLRHQPNFTAQLGFTALVAACLSILFPVESYVEYAANSMLLGEITLWLIVLIVLGTLFRFNLSFATNLQHITAIAFIAASALLLSVYIMLEFSMEDFSTQPEYPAVLKPPFAHISGSRDAQAFRDAFARGFDRADLLARQE